MLQSRAAVTEMRTRSSLVVACLGVAGIALAAGCPQPPAPSQQARVGDATPATGPQPPQKLVAPPPHVWSGAGCTAAACHAGIEPIRGPETGMMREIFARGQAHGDPDGCIMCHGGDPQATAVDQAHRHSPDSLRAAGGPEAFYPDPASPWVNAFTCGQCHLELVQAQWNSLMMTEAGKIQGTTWAFGALEGYEHRWANYDAKNPDDPNMRLGTDAYRVYMADKTAAHPNVFVDQMHALPEAPAPGTLEDLTITPEDAVFTYLRAECQRCHLGVKGRQRRGDYRGMGCGACHMPYSNEGLYEGGDATIPDQPGHALVHSLQATREAKVYVHEQGYTGIPVETCTTCHNRGKRIGVSYQGLMESAWASPYTEGGGGQIGLHTKHYISMEQDVHYQRGMLCQDCHTSIDVHGDRFLAGANLGPVEIECSDCHGTPAAYPWELPLGWGDENGPGQAKGSPRGVGQTLPDYLQRGTVAPVRDGYILTARGNPMPEVVRDGDRIVVHTVGGKDLYLEPLRKKADEGRLSAEATAAMVHAGKHIETMECYACHASWAPQCYGCHVKVDYSAGNRVFDWVAAGQLHAQDPDHRRDRGEDGYDTLIPGKVTEMRSYLRWEDPALGVNGEGRVSPIVPGCQVSATIIGEDGTEIVRNNIFHTTPGSEGSGPEGQLGSDMSPLQPHTIGKSRSCESCHGSDKAMGYGIGGGRMTAPWDRGKVVDLTTADGRVLPAAAQVQVEPIAGLQDWSAVVTRDGQQLQTVGHHFQGSGPLTAAQRRAMDRKNICVACHSEIPEASLAVSAMHHMAEMTGRLPSTKAEHADLVNKILLTSAWVQAGGGALLGTLLTLGGVVWWRRRHARARSG